MPATNRGVVEAAGALVTRKHQGKRQVLLIHRPKYDDWTWPKGKRDPGESLPRAAVREVLEESGVEIRLGRPLPRQQYAMSGGREKEVHYWVGHVVGDDDVSTYAANAEVDSVRWVSLKKARRKLTYTDDVALLNAFEEEPRRTDALVVLRHAKARPRSGWDGDDARRPLLPDGKEQAAALVPELQAYGASWVLSSGAKRCVHTVRPYAAAQVLPVQQLRELSEDGFDPRAAGELLIALLETRESVVVCTHRPVLPTLLDGLGVREEPLAPAEWVVAHHRRGRVVATERHLRR